MCDPLCGSTPIITSIIGSSCHWLGPWRAPLIPRTKHVPLLSHTTAKPRQADTSFDSQTMIGRHLESDPAGASRRCENPRDAYDNSIRHGCRRPPGAPNRIARRRSARVAVSIGAGSAWSTVSASMIRTGQYVRAAARCPGAKRIASAAPARNDAPERRRERRRWPPISSRHDVGWYWHRVVAELQTGRSADRQMWQVLRPRVRHHHRWCRSGVAAWLGATGGVVSARFP